MRTAWAFVLGAALATSAVADDTVNIGFFEMQPWIVPHQGGKPTGLAVDYWEKTLAPAMNVTLKWSGPTPMLRLLQQLEAGEIDAVVILSKTPEREKLFVYPKLSFVQFQPTLAVLKESRLAAVKSASDLAGVRIGYQQGGFVPPFLKDPQIKLDLISSPNWLQDNFAKLLASRVDAVFDVGTESLILLASMNGQAEKFRFVPLPVPPQPIFSAFARTPRGTALAAKYEPVNAQNAAAFKDVVEKFKASK